VKKFIAMLLMGAVLVTSLSSIGCGDDKGAKKTESKKTEEKKSEK